MTTEIKWADGNAIIADSTLRWADGDIYDYWYIVVGVSGWREQGMLTMLL